MSPSKSFIPLALVSILLFTRTAATLLIARDIIVPAPTPVAPGPYVFTDGVPGCTSGPGGSFNFNWITNTSLNDPTCGKGWAKGTNRTISYTGNFNANGYGKFAIYGWTRSPLVEYIIMETFGSSITPAAGAQKKGTATCNGRTYDLLRTTRVNQPSIDGVQTFAQYWSARYPPLRGNIQGTVDLECHFNAWKALGMDLGTHDYQIGAVDGYYSSGNATMTIS